MESAARSGLTYAAAYLYVTGLEEDSGRRDLLDHESTDGVTLSEGQNFVAGLEPDPCRAAIGIGMPGGAKNREIGKTAPVEAFDLPGLWRGNTGRRIWGSTCRLGAVARRPGFGSTWF